MRQERMPDTEFEELFGKKSSIKQSEFIVLPTFEAKALIEGTKPILKEHLKNAEIREKSKGIKINLSQIEIIYPWLLQKLGLIKGELNEWEISEKVNKASQLGQVIHTADSLFRAVMRARGSGEVEMFFPSHTKKRKREIKRIKAAIAGVPWVRKGMESEDIESILLEAWAKYDNQVDDHVVAEPENLPLPGFSIVNPIEVEEYRRGREVSEVVQRFAKQTAEQIYRGFNGEAISWEYELSAISQSNVLVIANFTGPGRIQLVSELDSVTRRTDGKGRVKIQHIDLKTHKEKKDGDGLVNESARTLRDEVELRQRQTLLLVSERFTSKFALKYENLEPRSAFAFRSSHNNRSHIGRVDKTANRMFNIETGEMKLDELVMNDEQRDEFEDWFLWFGIMIHVYRDEIRELARKNPRYKLNGIEVEGNFNDWKI